jgi:hypothetical protein
MPPKRAGMTACSSHPGCRSAALAKSLLETWLSGDRYRLRLELNTVLFTPGYSEDDDERDHIELLRNITSRMSESPDLYSPREESPRTAAWLDLLDHLSVTGATVN